MDETLTTRQAAMATARANVYGLLAGVFHGEPSAAFLAQLKDPSFSNVLKPLSLSLGDAFYETPEDKLEEDLAVEFTRLFIGPGPHISPHESVHLESDKTLYGRKTAEVKRFIEAAGLEYDDSFTGLPDHISAEFEFMQRLIEKEAEAWENGDGETAANILKIEKRFYDEHLSQWIPAFCGKVIDQSDGPFYREMAGVTKKFLDFEKGSWPPEAVST